MPGFIIFDKRPALGVLGRDLQIAADVMGDELLDVFRALDREIVAHAGGDHHLLDARRPRAPCGRARISSSWRGVQVRADAGKDAGRPPARRLDLRVLAGHAIHVGGRPADVGDDAGEARRLVADGLDLAQDRAFRAVLDDAALVLGDRAEGAAAEAAAHDRHRELDHVPGGDLGLAIGGMRRAGVGQLVDRVHLRAWSAESAAASARGRDRRGAAPAGAHCRDCFPGAARARRGHRPRGPLDLLVRRQADHGVAGLQLRAFVGGVEIVGVQFGDSPPARA